MRIPLGLSDFGKLRTDKNPNTQEGYTYVDKSLLIKEIIDDSAEVILFTRPRRFGKTLNLSMLEYFFAKEVLSQPTKELFKELKISEYPQYMAYQGKYPVIFISFKDIKNVNFKAALEDINNLIVDVYNSYTSELSSTKFTKTDRIYIDKILEYRANTNDLANSLQKLIKFLYQYYGQKPILLIDEYDTPLHYAYIHEYYPDLIEFLKKLFSKALKDNKTLHKAILTGILRVSKENLFSGLNHLETYSLLDSRYAEYFGFTEDETTKLLEQASLKYELKEIKNWYNGYNFGGVTIYNPWSILKCIKENGVIKSYWVNTSGNELLKQLIINSRSEIKDHIEKLLQGESINVSINENMVFADLENHPASIWSLLLFSGYLKYLTADIEDLGWRGNLTLPNKEIETVYMHIIKQWLRGDYDNDWHKNFLDALLSGNIEAFAAQLETLVLETLSCHDVSKKSQESFYHGLMLGLIVNVRHMYIIKSNKETGLGRYDISLIPKDHTKPGIVIELKMVEDSHKLTSTAKKALKQIDTSKYTTELKNLGIKNIKTIGIAFAGKALKVLGN